MQLDVQAAKQNPSKFFASPKEVLMHPHLSREAKLDILHQWETDARLLQVADEENLQGGEPSQLGAVVAALLALDDEEKQAHTGSAPAPATKAGH
jgi:hypothetical protein